jgi:hypothetical protein
MLRSMRFLFLLPWLPVGVVAADLKPGDFAFGFPLAADGKDATYRLELPSAVYRGVARADLADLRIFNGAGEIVPHSLQHSTAATAGRTVTSQLKCFALPAAVSASDSDLSLHLKTDRAGTVLDLRKTAAKKTETANGGYLCDLGRDAPPLEAIVLLWPASESGWVGAVDLGEGSDLKNWNALAHAAPLVDLQQGGERLLQQRIEFANTKTRYLRIDWAGDTAARTLSAVAAERRGEPGEAPRRWNEPVTPVNSAPHEYVFDLGGLWPVDRVRLELPQANTLIRAELLGRATPDEPWQSVLRSSFYRLNVAGREITGQAHPTERRSWRYWLLRVDPKGGGLGAGMPRLTVAWVPHQVLFVARGSAPYQLAYGSAKASRGDLPIESLLPKLTGLNTLKPTEVLIPATLDSAPAPTTLGGPSQLSRPTDWKTIGLWALLGGGVLLLGFFAWRLLGQMDRPAESR